MSRTARVAAIDLGATSGRVMSAVVGPGQLDVHEVTRFENRPVRIRDGLHWNTLSMFDEALRGVASASRSAAVDSVAVDSWAVDYALLRNGDVCALPYSYRDDRTARGLELVDAVLPYRDLYRRCGLQRMPFTTINQLSVDRERGVLQRADSFLLLPDLFNYWMTGVARAERTNASTTGLLGLDGQWDVELARMLGIDPTLPPELVEPGTVLAPIDEAIREHFEIIGAPVVTAVGSHDTASAVVATPLDEHGAFISCGTWSLVGVELPAPVASDDALAASITNEGGVDGRTRFLKNIMGLWILSETLQEWGVQASTDLGALLERAREVGPAAATFDASDGVFYAPGAMTGRIAEWLESRDLPTPSSKPAFVRCILESLAATYAATLADVARIADVRIDRVHIVGGGARNGLLCQLTADRTGLPVLAGPVEASAIGNVLVQARALGAISGELSDLRSLVRATHDITTFEPRAA